MSPITRGATVARTRYKGPEFLERYDAGEKSYRENWEHIDLMMNGVVAANTARTFNSIHTKVVLIDGIYRSQLSRRVGPNAPSLVANELKKSNRTLNAIDSLSISHHLDLSSIAEVLTVHSEIVKVVKLAI